MVECAAKGELNFEDCVSREYCHRFEAHYIVLIIRCRQTLLAIIRGFYVTRPLLPHLGKWKYTFPDVQNARQIAGTPYYAYSVIFTFSGK